MLAEYETLVEQNLKPISSVEFYTNDDGFIKLGPKKVHISDPRDKAAIRLIFERPKPQKALPLTSLSKVLCSSGFDTGYTKEDLSRLVQLCKPGQEFMSAISVYGPNQAPWVCVEIPVKISHARQAPPVVNPSRGLNGEKSNRERSASTRDQVRQKIAEIEDLEGTLEKLTVRERQALEVYLGLDGNNVGDMSQKALGAALGVNRGTAQRFIANALRRLETGIPAISVAIRPENRHTNDEATTRKLFQENKTLVPYIFNRFFSRWRGTPEMDDILQDGLCALWDASKGFDKSMGFKFSTYACKSITRGMSRRTRVILRHSHVASLHKPITEDGLSLSDTISSPNSTEGDAINHLLVRSALNSLTPRERKIVEMTHGVGEDEVQLTTLEIGRYFKISDARVYYIYQEALKKMRASLVSA